MPGYPPLDPEALRRLRELVRDMNARRESGLPVHRLVELARDVRLDAGVTIDFEGADESDAPMVVLRMPHAAPPAPCLDELSRREREIAALIADGLSNKEIAKRLFISLATVKDHVHRMLRKAGLSNRAALASAVRGHVADNGDTNAIDAPPAADAV
jgi:DNA-binding NarL/FixJ family response regulator